MSKTPYLQFYVNDYIGDTQHLTTEQHGAYLLLLFSLWSKGGRLPNDDRKIAIITRLSLKKWLATKDDIMSFFVVDGETFYNKRLIEEFQKVEALSEKRSAAGAKGFQAKSLKNNDTHEAIAEPLLKHSHNHNHIQNINPHSSDLYLAENIEKNGIEKPENQPAERRSFDESQPAENLFVEADEMVQRTDLLGLPLEKKSTAIAIKKPREEKSMGVCTLRAFTAINLTGVNPQTLEDNAMISLAMQSQQGKALIEACRDYCLDELFLDRAKAAEAIADFLRYWLFQSPKTARPQWFSTFKKSPALAATSRNSRAQPSGGSQFAVSNFPAQNYPNRRLTTTEILAAQAPKIEALANRMFPDE